VFNENESLSQDSRPEKDRKQEEEGKTRKERRTSRSSHEEQEEKGVSSHEFEYHGRPDITSGVDTKDISGESS
jgi:hypothetical protein